MLKTNLLATTVLTSIVSFTLPAHAWVVTDCTTGSVCTTTLPDTTMVGGSAFSKVQWGDAKIVDDNQGTRWSPYDNGTLYDLTVYNPQNLGGIYLYLGPKLHASNDGNFASIANLANNGKSDINIFAQTVAGSETYDGIEYPYGLSTTGENSPAILANHTGSGDINVEYGAVLHTSGKNSGGFVLTHQGSGNINFTGSEDVKGSIWTGGENSTAITAQIAAGTTTIDTSDIKITTTGDHSAGINVMANETVSGNDVGKITIISGEISTGLLESGEKSHGIVVGKRVEGDLNVTAGDISITALGDITTHGLSSRGIWAQNNGSKAGNITIDTSASSIVTEGVGEVDQYYLSSDGIYAQAGLGNVDIIAGNISTAGLGNGVFASSSAKVDVRTVEDTAIYTKSEFSSGILARSTGGGAVNIELNGNVNTAGKSAHGVDASSVTTDDFFPFPLPGGDVSLVQNGGFLTATGIGAVGALLSGGTGTSSEIKGSIRASGEFGTGLLAISNGENIINIVQSANIHGGWQKDVAGTSSFTEATKAAGIGVSGAKTVINNRGIIDALSDRAIYDYSSTMDGKPGGSTAINNSGLIEGFIDLSGSSGNQFINQDYGRFAIRHLADTDGDGNSDTKRVAVNDFGKADSSFVNEAGGGIEFTYDYGQINFDTQGYYNATTGYDSRMLDSGYYNLSRAGVVQGQMLNLGSLSNSGTIDLRNNAVGNTLVITSSNDVHTVGTAKYIANGGVLYLSAVLNEGLSAGGTTGSQADMLITDQTELGTGATLISVINRGGAGAYTAGNGIQLVEVRDKQASAEGVFALDGEYAHNGKQAVVGGAYAYTLFKNGVGEDSTDGNWYLRSQLIETDPEDPLYQIGVPSYEAYPQVLLGLNGLPTLQQRVGNRYWSNAGNIMLEQGDGPGIIPAAPSAEAGSYTETNGIWGRIEGQHLRAKPAVTTSGTNYDVDTIKLQAGLDGLLLENEDGKLIGGITVHYGHATAKTFSAHGNGKISTDGYGFGGTLTWYADNGFYIDGQGQLTWYNSDLEATKGDVGSLTSDNNGFGYALSVESGKRFTLDQQWSLTPQAQLVYSHVNFDQFNDRFGVPVSLDKGESLQGRIGLSLERQDSWHNDQGMINRSYLYGIANLYYEFLDGTSVTVEDVSFSSRNDRLWGGIGLGGSYNWNDDKYSLYGEGSVNTSLGNFGDSYAYKGTVGLRVKW